MTRRRCGRPGHPPPQRRCDTLPSTATGHASHYADGTVREWLADVVAATLPSLVTECGALAWFYGDWTRFALGFKDLYLVLREGRESLGAAGGASRRRKACAMAATSAASSTALGGPSPRDLGHRQRHDGTRRPGAKGRRGGGRPSVH